MAGNGALKTVALAAALAAASASQAFETKTTVWKGETLSIILPDECRVETGEKSGVSVETGTIRPVLYNATPKSLEYRIKADRAVLGSREPGIHFASIRAAPDAAPGEYAFGLLRVKVLDRTLPPPSEWRYRLDLWQHPWAVARLAGAKPFSPEHYKAMAPLWKMLADAGQKAVTATICDRPWNQQCYDPYGSMVEHRLGADGKWTFGYATFDEYVEFAFSCGLGPEIDCYTMCPWNYMVDYIDAAGATVRREARPGTPFFEEYWGTFLPDFERHLAAKGWLGRTAIAMDERSPDDLARIVKFVRAKAPGLKIAMAGNRSPREFEGLEIDKYAQSMGHVDAAFMKEAEQRRKEGKSTTYYVCCGPARPNTFLKSEPAEAFVCGFLPAATGLDGFLRWAYNCWGENPMEDATYTRWTAGDVSLVYPDGSPSWRFLELRNGIVAAEKHRILRESGRLDARRAATLAAKLDPHTLISKGADWERLRSEAMSLVNR